MKYIKLTSTNNRPVYLFINQITYISESDRAHAGSHVLTVGSNSALLVIETPEAIIKLIEGESWPSIT